MKNKCATCCLLLVCVTQALFGQTPRAGIRSSEPQVSPPAISPQEQLILQAQLDAARLEAVPSEARFIRERQLKIAREQEVDLNFRDKGRVSETAIRGVPADLRDITIRNEYQVIALADALYPLFGFGGTEKLIYQGKVGSDYRFTEEINGLPVESPTISIVVGPTQEIVAIQGTAVINRNFGEEHPLDTQRAIGAVNRYLEAEGLAPSSGQNSDNAHLIYKHWDDYRTLAPWWFVEAHGLDFYVDPDGVVSSAVIVTY